MADRRDQSGACSVAEYLRLQSHFETQDRDTLVELLSLQRIETQPLTKREPKRCQVQFADSYAEAFGTPFAAFTPDASDYPARIPALPFIQHWGSREKKRALAAKASPRKTAKLSPKQYERQRISSIRLQPWEVLWPFIKRELNRLDDGRGSLDVPRLIDDICAVRPLNALPLSRRQTWPQELIILVDHSPHLMPVYEDFLDIIQRLRG